MPSSKWIMWWGNTIGMEWTVTVITCQWEFRFCIVFHIYKLCGIRIALIKPRSWLIGHCLEANKYMEASRNVTLWCKDRISPSHRWFLVALGSFCLDADGLETEACEFNDARIPAIYYLLFTLPLRVAYSSPSLFSWTHSPTERRQTFVLLLDGLEFVLEQDGMHGTGDWFCNSITLSEISGRMGNVVHRSVSFVR